MKWTGRFQGYNGGAFRKDIVSGVVVGIIAIPLGMAFAIASGVRPEYGLYTTIVAGILVSLFGGSRFQIAGPTGAFIPVLFVIVMQYGYADLLLAGFMAGVLLALMGLFRLGGLVRYIPRPVTIGFTAGIAVLIFSGQIAGFLGLEGLTKHEDFLSNMRELGTHIGGVNGYSLLTGAICLIILIVLPRYAPKLPASLVGIVVSTGIAALCYPGALPTIGSAFGAIPSALPSFEWPHITMERVLSLWQPALIIAGLGAIESLLSAVVADGMTGTRHDSNRELIGQGVANMVVPLFGGIPATGAIARTAANIKAGAVSPLSGVIHGATVLAVLLLLAPYATHIPLASMAPILMMVAWHMSERRAFLYVLKTRSGDAAVLLLTFLLTVGADLTVAVLVGLALAALLFVKRMSDLAHVTRVLPDPADARGKVRPGAIREDRDCPQISIYTIEGALFFGTTAPLDAAIQAVAERQPRILVLRMGRVPLLDTSGEARLATLAADVEAAGGIMLLTGVQQQPLDLIRQTGLDERIGAHRIFAHTGTAIDYALTRLDEERCRGCRHFAFRECAALSGLRSLPAQQVQGAKQAAAAASATGEPVRRVGL
ncbi:sodium-independent anion transporter [Paenibacillus sp. 598K]|uniref:SulP family inorganic anion transporter n=1 Tax=Paenibacillus sp. 598K TaxID=1117987 RepID=UPI000FFAC869|nr:SulP family inorganic anion transporter [Paenibacillus sp. 598K]GBF77567.1 sodium-independent anion transporter [Paenibacillus sp. 598K]